MAKQINVRRVRLAKKVRSRIIGKTEFPRLSIFRSSKYIYAQVIDDEKHITLAAGFDRTTDNKKATKTEKAKQMGLTLGAKLKELKIKQVVFDRGSFQYMGRVQAVAEGVREAGITI
jgi:large subunit ribosomal protein L18